MAAVLHPNRGKALKTVQRARSLAKKTDSCSIRSNRAFTMPKVSEKTQKAPNANGIEKKKNKKRKG